MDRLAISGKVESVDKLLTFCGIGFFIYVYILCLCVDVCIVCSPSSLSLSSLSLSLKPFRFCILNRLSLSLSLSPRHSGFLCCYCKFIMNIMQPPEHIFAFPVGDSRCEIWTTCRYRYVLRLGHHETGAARTNFTFQLSLRVRFPTSKCHFRCFRFLL